MKRHALALVQALAMTAAGCTLVDPAGRQDADRMTADLDRNALVKDSVATLAQLYPPAWTRLKLQQPASDAFGTALVKQLRARGYAIQEAGSKPGLMQSLFPSTPEKRGRQEQKKPVEYAPDDPATLPLRYVLAPLGPELYQLTITIGTQSLTRPYLHRDGRLAAAGAWIRKE